MRCIVPPPLALAALVVLRGGTNGFLDRRERPRPPPSRASPAASGARGPVSSRGWGRDRAGDQLRWGSRPRRRPNNVTRHILPAREPLLAPLHVGRVFDLLARLREQGTTILLIEQNVRHVLQIVDHAYVLEHGRVVLEGDGRALLENPRLRTAYLGM